MSGKQTLAFEQYIQAPVEDGLRAFTHPTMLRDWWCQAALCEPVAHGPISLQWNDGYFASGRLVGLPGAEALEFSWVGRNEPGESRVRVNCRAVETGCVVTVTHELGAGPAWEETRERLQQQWPAWLENMQSMVENGIDLRLARRPRLGIWMDDLTPEKAAELRLPAVSGVLLSGTGENTGARNAGLRKDDVLVSMNDVPLHDPSSFGQALEGLHAGDWPVVSFYREGKLQSTPLELSRFPILPLPTSPAALAEAFCIQAAHVAGSIAELVAGLDEAQALHRPAENE
jgi:uncharacterized protein YndB with AHSA1/START domain